MFWERVACKSEERACQAHVPAEIFRATALIRAVVGSPGARFPAVLRAANRP